MSNVTDPTGGLLADLVAIVRHSGGHVRWTVHRELVGQRLDPCRTEWRLADHRARPRAILPLGRSAVQLHAGLCDPTPCGFTSPCDISLLCDYTDTDSDGLLDRQEVPGCSDPAADNYNPTPRIRGRATTTAASTPMLPTSTVRPTPTTAPASSRWCSVNTSFMTEAGTMTISGSTDAEPILQRGNDVDGIRCVPGHV